MANNQPTVSIVIRTLNEAESLQRLLLMISNQIDIDQKDVEIIVVDNESSDATPKVAANFGAQVINIPRNEFSYPKSMNLGVQAAQAPIVILTVGHAVPINENWITSALKHFENPSVAGVYSPVLPNNNAGIFERIMYLQGYFRAKMLNPKCIRKIGSGVFGATNVALRKKLWEQHPFEEKYGLSGEDTQWAKWAISHKYSIIRETGFAVYHSHGLSLIGVIKQALYWRRLSKPAEFSSRKLGHRKDIKW